jgi:hypothetical protein
MFACRAVDLKFRIARCADSLNKSRYVLNPSRTLAMRSGGGNRRKSDVYGFSQSSVVFDVDALRHALVDRGRISTEEFFRSHESGTARRKELRSVLAMHRG